MIDRHADPGFQQYLAAIERYPVLDRDRELELARKFHDGDKACGDLLVSCSLRYVAKIAAGYRGYGFRLSELVGEGNVGMLQALRRFAPERGLRFMTYASYWVRAHILTFILKHWSLVSLGTAPIQSKLFFRLAREKARLAARLGEGADLTARLARTFECSEERIRKMEQRMGVRDQSLDAKLPGASPKKVMDVLVADVIDQETAYSAQEVAELVRTRIDAAIAQLDEREKIIVERRLLCAQKDTLAELGRELGISRERVRQLEHRIKFKLRRKLADLAPADAQPMPLAA